mmetsp:Transcript_5709/g.12501  ORF Transcript_5709/g.12501 Transcript_5709/m.12501 type:complete len:228 (+) Transcript_5709:1055-1738(+)
MALDGVWSVTIIGGCSFDVEVGATESVCAIDGVEYLCESCYGTTVAQQSVLGIRLRHKRLRALCFLLNVVQADQLSEDKLSWVDANATPRMPPTTLTGSWEAVLDGTSSRDGGARLTAVLRRPHCHKDASSPFKVGDRAMFSGEAAVVKNIECCAGETWCEVVCSSQVPRWAKAAELLPREAGVISLPESVAIRSAVECFKRAASPSCRGRGCQVSKPSAPKKPRVQ